MNKRFNIKVPGSFKYSAAKSKITENTSKLASFTDISLDNTSVNSNYHSNTTQAEKLFEKKSNNDSTYSVHNM